MTALRRLGGSYVAVASAGAILFTIAQYRESQTQLQNWPAPRIEFRWLPAPPQGEAAPRIAVAPAPSSHASVPTHVAQKVPSLRRLAPPALRQAPPAPPPVQFAGQNTPELRHVEARLKDELTGELYANFKLYLYVSKAQSGPIAQRMYVFERSRKGLALLYDWPVSTGREQLETDYEGTEVSTRTPAGYYELDPNRFYAYHVSTEWREPMPYAMFLNWIKDGAKTGLAIHAATGSGVSELGSRASAGCIRLAPEDARTLFNLIRDRYRGRVPRFEINRRTGTMSTNGLVLRDAKGQVKLAEGYKVLVLIDNYGGSNLVAAVF